MWLCVYLDNCVQIPSEFMIAHTMFSRGLKLSLQTIGWSRYGRILLNSQSYQTENKIAVTCCNKLASCSLPILAITHKHTHQCITIVNTRSNDAVCYHNGFVHPVDWMMGLGAVRMCTECLKCAPNVHEIANNQA